MTQDNETSPTFETSDFYVACFLKSREIKLIGTKELSKFKSIFIFEYQDGLEQKVRDFYNDKIYQSFISAIRELKGYTRKNITGGKTI